MSTSASPSALLGSISDLAKGIQENGKQIIYLRHQATHVCSQVDKVQRVVSGLRSLVNLKDPGLQPILKTVQEAFEQIADWQKRLLATSSMLNLIKDGAALDAFSGLMLKLDKIASDFCSYLQVENILTKSDRSIELEKILQDFEELETAFDGTEVSDELLSDLPNGITVADILRLIREQKVVVTQQLEVRKAQVSASGSILDSTVVAESKLDGSHEMGLRIEVEGVKPVPAPSKSSSTPIATSSATNTDGTTKQTTPPSGQSSDATHPSSHGSRKRPSLPMLDLLARIPGPDGLLASTLAVTSPLVAALGATFSAAGIDMGTSSTQPVAEAAPSNPRSGSKEKKTESASVFDFGSSSNQPANANSAPSASTNELLTPCPASTSSTGEPTTPKTCLVVDCNEPRSRRGYCVKHQELLAPSTPTTAALSGASQFPPELIKGASFTNLSAPEKLPDGGPTPASGPSGSGVGSSPQITHRTVGVPQQFETYELLEPSLTALLESFAQHPQSSTTQLLVLKGITQHLLDNLETGGVPAKEPRRDSEFSVSGRALMHPPSEGAPEKTTTTSTDPSSTLDSDPGEVDGFVSVTRESITSLMRENGDVARLGPYQTPNEAAYCDVFDYNEAFNRTARVNSINNGQESMRMHEYVRSKGDPIYGITDITITFSRKPELVPPGYSLVTRTFGDRLADLNAGAGSKRIFLCYRKQPLEHTQGSLINLAAAASKPTQYLLDTRGYLGTVGANTMRGLATLGSVSKITGAALLKEDEAMETVPPPPPMPIPLGTGMYSAYSAVVHKSSAFAAYGSLTKQQLDFFRLPSAQTNDTNSSESQGETQIDLKQAMSTQQQSGNHSGNESTTASPASHVGQEIPSVSQPVASAAEANSGTTPTKMSVGGLDALVTSTGDVIVEAIPSSKSPLAFTSNLTPPTPQLRQLFIPPNQTSEDRIATAVAGSDTSDLIASPATSYSSIMTSNAMSNVQHDGAMSTPRGSTPRGSGLSLFGPLGDTRATPIAEVPEENDGAVEHAPAPQLITSTPLRTRVLRSSNDDEKEQTMNPTGVALTTLPSPSPGLTMGAASPATHGRRQSIEDVGSYASNSLYADIIAKSAAAARAAMGDTASAASDDSSLDALDVPLVGSLERDTNEALLKPGNPTLAESRDSVASDCERSPKMLSLDTKDSPKGKDFATLRSPSIVSTVSSTGPSSPEHSPRTDGGSGNQPENAGTEISPGASATEMERTSSLSTQVPPLMLQAAVDGQGSDATESSLKSPTDLSDRSFIRQPSVQSDGLSSPTISSLESPTSLPVSPLSLNTTATKGSSMPPRNPPPAYGTYNATILQQHMRAAKEVAHPFTSINVIFRECEEEPPLGFELVDRAIGRVPANLNTSTSSSREIYLATHAGRGAPIVDLGVRMEGKEQLPSGWHEVKHSAFGHPASLNSGNDGYPQLRLAFRVDIQYILDTTLYCLLSENGQDPANDLFVRTCAVLLASVYSGDETIVMSALDAFRFVPPQVCVARVVNAFIQAVCNAAPLFLAYFTTTSHAYFLSWLVFAQMRLYPLLSVETLTLLFETCFLLRHEDKTTMTSTQLLDHIIQQVQSGTLNRPLPIPPAFQQHIQLHQKIQSRAQSYLRQFLDYTPEEGTTFQATATTIPNVTAVKSEASDELDQHDRIPNSDAEFLPASPARRHSLQPLSTILPVSPAPPEVASPRLRSYSSAQQPGTTSNINEYGQSTSNAPKLAPDDHMEEVRKELMSRAQSADVSKGVLAPSTLAHSKVGIRSRDATGASPKGDSHSEHAEQDTNQHNKSSNVVESDANFVENTSGAICAIAAKAGDDFDINEITSTIGSGIIPLMPAVPTDQETSIWNMCATYVRAIADRVHEARETDGDVGRYHRRPLGPQFHADISLLVDRHLRDRFPRDWLADPPIIHHSRGSVPNVSPYTPPPQKIEPEPDVEPEVHSELPETGGEGEAKPLDPKMQAFLNLQSTLASRKAKAAAGTVVETSQSTPLLDMSKHHGSLRRKPGSLGTLNLSQLSTSATSGIDSKLVEASTPRKDTTVIIAGVKVPWRVQQMMKQSRWTRVFGKDPDKYASGEEYSWTHIKIEPESVKFETPTERRMRKKHERDAEKRDREKKQRETQQRALQDLSVRLEILDAVARDPSTVYKDERLFLSVLILCCKVAISGPNVYTGRKSECLKRKTHALNLILYLLQHSDGFLRSNRATIAILRRFVVPCVIICGISDVHHIFRASLQIFVTLFQVYRGEVLAELGEFMNLVLLRVVTSPYSSLEQRKDALDSLAHIVSTPVSLINVYYAFDRRSFRCKVLAHFVAVLCNIVEGDFKLRRSGSYFGSLDGDGTLTSSAANAVGNALSAEAAERNEDDAPLETFRKHALRMVVNILFMLSQWVGVPSTRRTDDACEALRLTVEYFSPGGAGAGKATPVQVPGILEDLVKNEPKVRSAIAAKAAAAGAAAAAAAAQKQHDAEVAASVSATGAPAVAQRGVPGAGRGIPGTGRGAPGAGAGRHKQSVSVGGPISTAAQPGRIIYAEKGLGPRSSLGVEEVKFAQTLIQLKNSKLGPEMNVDALIANLPSTTRATALQTFNAALAAAAAGKPVRSMITSLTHATAPITENPHEFLEMAWNRAAALSRQSGKDIKDAVRLLRSLDPVFITIPYLVLFLRCMNLDPVKLGDYISNQEDSIFDADTFRKLRIAFADSMDFTGLSIDAALRFYLTKAGFRLPGEGQKIDRMMEALAIAYCRQNPDEFPSVDAAHFVAFALIVLNTDHHNPSLRTGKGKQRKMTLDEFKKSLENGLDGHPSFSDSFVEHLYNSIANEPIEILTGDSAGSGSSGDAASGAMSPPASGVGGSGSGSSSGSSTGISGENLAQLLNGTIAPPPADALTLAPMSAMSRPRIAKTQTEQECRILSRLNVESMEADARTALAMIRMHAPFMTPYMYTLSTQLLLPIWESCWRYFASALTALLESTDDVDALSLCIDGLTYAASISIVLGLVTERQAFASLLAKIYFCEKNCNDDRATLRRRIASGEHQKVDWYRTLNLLCERNPADACRKLSDMANITKELIIEQREQQLLKKLQNDFGGEIVLVEAQRALLFRGMLTKISSTGRRQDYSFFLFTDLLVYASEGMQQSYRVHRAIHLSLIKIEDMPFVPYAFRIVSPQKSFVVLAPTVEQKEMWISKIVQAVKRIIMRRDEWLRNQHALAAAISAASTGGEPDKLATSAAAAAALATAASVHAPERRVSDEDLTRRMSSFINHYSASRLPSLGGTSRSESDLGGDRQGSGDLPATGSGSSGTLGLGPSTSGSKPYCKLCLRLFALFRRRATLCQCCQDEVCSECMNHRVTLDGKANQKVCDACWGFLTKLVPTSPDDVYTVLRPEGTVAGTAAVGGLE